MMTPRRANAPVELLLVEDNEGDVRLMRDAMAEGRLNNTLRVVRDGEEAMAFLRRQGAFASAPRPGLIILDLNLPRKDGREVLIEIKGDPFLRAIPVVVLTTSQSEEDVLTCYDNGASCYLVKPVDLERFTETVSLLRDFWLGAVKLSPAGQGVP